MKNKDEISEALPGRRARLKAFISLKRERLVLRSALSAAIFALGVTGLVVMDSPSPEPILLGEGRAGIDTALAPVQIARLDPMPIIDLPDATPEVMSDAIEAAEDALSAAAEELGVGSASYYGDRFAGRKTANGEIFDPLQMTAAHRTLPMGSKVRVTHEKTGESVIVRINDRGPYHGKRVIDLSKQAAKRLGMIRSGTARVKLELLKS